MLAYEVIGSVAGVLTTASFLPQAIKTIKDRDTKALSLSMYLIFTTGVLLWLLYGWFQQDYPLVIANGITALFCLIILSLKLKTEGFFQRKRL